MSGRESFDSIWLNRRSLEHADWPLLTLHVSFPDSKDVPDDDEFDGDEDMPEDYDSGSNSRDPKAPYVPAAVVCATLIYAYERLAH